MNAKYDKSESDMNIKLLHAPRHESEDHDITVVLNDGLVVGLLICWSFVFVFLECFVIFILASNVKLSEHLRKGCFLVLNYSPF